MKGKKMITILRNTLSEEKADLMEETNGQLTDFQKGIIFGLRLAIVKATNENNKK